MLEQESIAATHFRREGEDRVGRVLVDTETPLAFPTLGIKVPLGALYEGIDLTPAEPEAA